jgi:RNA polymerase sigma factor (sigma-70 family)
MAASKFVGSWNRSPKAEVVGSVTRSEVAMGDVLEPHATPSPPHREIPAVESFDDVFRRESDAMVRVAYLMVRSAPQAEEIVQDAFTRLLERWDRIPQPGAYLRTCVVNGCKDALRRRALERRRAVSEPARHPVDLEVDHLGDALAALPVKRRAAIVLRYYDGLSEAEIAKVLRVRPGTVKSLVHRGLLQLREVVER